MTHILTRLTTRLQQRTKRFSTFIVLFLIIIIIYLKMYICCNKLCSVVYVLERVFSTFQIMVNVMHARPRYDFSADYFVKIYRAECVCLRLHCNLIKSILDKQVCTAFVWNILHTRER